MNTAVITFAPNGSARCLYSELIDLHQIGQLNVARASNVEFSAAKQRWEVHGQKPRVIGMSRPRAFVRRCQRKQAEIGQIRRIIQFTRAPFRIKRVSPGAHLPVGNGRRPGPDCSDEIFDSVRIARYLATRSLVVWRYTRLPALPG